MKVINFNVKEILPSLLDKTKCSTMRPAWKICKLCNDDGYTKSLSMNFTCTKHNYLKFNLDKPSKFKVGEEAKLMWKQRSLYSIFTVKDGEALCSAKYDNKKILPKKLFQKTLTIVKITEVFKIEITKKVNIFFPNDNFYYCIKTFDQFMSNEGIDNLAKKEGFKSKEDMFKFFDKRYDLSEPKEFWVYRWDWL